MLILDLNTGSFIDSEKEEPTIEYPDEVLDAEWNPMLSQIQPVQPDDYKFPHVVQIVDSSIDID